MKPGVFIGLLLTGLISSDDDPFDEDQIETVMPDENGTVTLQPGKNAKISLGGGSQTIKIAPPPVPEGMPPPPQPPPPKMPPEPVAEWSDKANLRVDLTKENKDPVCNELEMLVNVIIKHLRTPTMRKVFKVGFLNDYNRYMKEKIKFGFLEPRGRKKLLCAVLKFKSMQEIADFFKTSMEETCSMFHRAVESLIESGGSNGFREYHQLGWYLSEFANRTGFPKFPLKNETELAMSRFFQTVKDETTERVEHLATPLLPFARVDPPVLAAWLRTSLNMNSYVRKIELATNMPLRFHTGHMRDWIRMLQTNYRVFEAASEAVEMLENSGLPEVDMSVCGRLDSDERDESEDEEFMDD